MSNYEEDVWSNEILENDDEATIKLKQRLNRAEAELDRENEIASKYQEKYNNKSFNSFKRHKKEKKYSSIVANPDAKGLARFGYDEQAHNDMKNEKGYIENLIENPKTRMAFYIGISILCIGLIVAEIFLF